MEGFSFKYSFGQVTVVSALALVVLFLPAYGQINTPCTTSMVNSFAPCLNFITNGNSTSPTVPCCSSLKSLTSASADCACNILTGNVPFQIPINRTLAVALPQACNSSSMPLQCKVGGLAPAPAPAPASFGPSPLPSATSPTPEASSVPGSVSPAAEPDTPSTTLTPGSSPSGTTSPDVRPTVTPPNSAASFSTISLSSALVSLIGFMIL
ncbi:Bifunctional inhibitor/lipid-transfer protein/seed storage 2S albumin superfamily protein [Thalictrum thalictroides]|uniref:Bifunctional inhibitor/lipid-transfer protein/seed storage 2S albumin superfamily protein n=1 Tax=Thalictrum thalictroides TaxID=46969 RepID=A0A7J6UXB0_THATH|nr:Bifunctional inhibitor/lipid-transfer protein/seed storage 2S albumin superfamily protein [Thalictrum thalictroides]